MEKVKALPKNSCVGVTSIIILTATMLGATLYNYKYLPNAENLTHDEHYAIALEAFSAFVEIFFILLIGSLLSLGLAVVSLLRKERKLFSLITISSVLTFLIISVLLLVFH